MRVRSEPGGRRLAGAPWTGARRARPPLPCLVAAALLALVGVGVGASAATAAAGPRVVLFAPHAYQVFQRDATGLAGVRVTGRLIGMGGSVQVRWASKSWVRAACSPAGRFGVTLPARPAGQGRVVVRATRRHSVAAVVPFVGIGDLYVIAGQSNASGRGQRLNRAKHPTLKAGLFGNDDHWGPLVDPTDGAAGQVDLVSKDPDAAGSVWPLVATRLMRREAVPVAFIPCSAGSTTIAGWQRSAVDPSSPQTLFGSMVRRVRAVGGRVRAVLFWQGELDARLLTSRSAYAARLARLAVDVREATGAPLVPAQIGDFTFTRWTAEGIDAIRLAQEDVLLAPQPAGGLVPGPLLYDVDLSPGWHPVTDAQSAAIADRWTAAVRAGVLGVDSARPPLLLGAAYDGATTVTVTFAVGGGALTSGAVGGFVLRAAGLPVALVGAEAMPPDRVVLRLQEAVPVASWADLTLSLGSGRDGAGAAVPVESSAWRLPPWPFVAEPVAPPEPGASPPL